MTKLYLSTEVEVRATDTGQMVLWDVEEGKPILLLTSEAGEKVLLQAIDMWGLSKEQLTKRAEEYRARREAENKVNGGGKRPPVKRKKKSKEVSNN